MFGIHDLPLFIGVALLLNVTPGADMLYVIGRSAAQGRSAGCLAAFGIAVGCLIHTVFAAAGLSAILATSATAFSVLKYVGAGYLVYLGLSALRELHDGPRAASPLPGRLPASRVFIDGVFINALNPKVGLFFLAFLPQFVSAGQPGSLPGFLVLGLVFNVGGTLVNVLVAVFASRLSARVRRGSPAARGIKAAMGAGFVVLGIRLAFAERT